MYRQAQIEYFSCTGLDLGYGRCEISIESRNVERHSRLLQPRKKMSLGQCTNCLLTTLYECCLRTHPLVSQTIGSDAIVVAYTNLKGVRKPSLQIMRGS